MMPAWCESNGHATNKFCARAGIRAFGRKDLRIMRDVAGAVQCPVSQANSGFSFSATRGRAHGESPLPDGRT
jgi:hypothetical protein